MVLEKDLSQVENYFIRCRKFGWSIIFITQSWFKVPKTIRLNVNYVAILKIGSKRDLNLILSEVGIGVSKEELIGMYDHATSKKLDVLLIHVEKSPSQKFYHNFPIFAFLIPWEIIVKRTTLVLVNRRSGEKLFLI